MGDDLFAAARALGRGDYPEAIRCLDRELVDAARSGDRVRLLQVAQLAESLRGKPGVDEAQVERISQAARKGTTNDQLNPTPASPNTRPSPEHEITTRPAEAEAERPSPGRTPRELSTCPRCGARLVAEARCALAVSSATVAGGVIENVEYEGEPEPTEVIALRCASGHELGVHTGSGRLRWLGG